MGIENPGALTDAQARNLVIKSLRQARQRYRFADTLGEKVERELDRLIKRKTRINANSLRTLTQLYDNYQQGVAQIQMGLTPAIEVASRF